MDSRIIEILPELGCRLNSFGEGDAHSAAVNIARDMLMPEALAAWMARYPALPVEKARNVLVVMAGNIPFVGMHDLVCVLAAGHRAMVKPSSKDRENIEWVVKQLLEIEPGLPVSLADEPLSTPPGAVVAMGSDATVAAIGERWAGVPMLLRGNRSSLAVLAGDEYDGELSGLADDVLLYSGLGCRSVSLVLAPRGYDFFKLQNIFNQREPWLDMKYRNNRRQARAMLRMGCVHHIDCGVCLLVENNIFSNQPSILHYAFYDDISKVKVWVKEHDSEIQCIATNFQLPRAVGFGRTQRPLLDDYPDGRDTMQFLAGI